ncbi:MAG: type II toxin-antitoxin system VapC family toxin [Cutibacterium acnes]|nr:type II toxin-antitoxin system VapC family toxin [Cutibacterium acnes]
MAQTARTTVGRAAWQQWGGEEFIAPQHLPAEIAHVVRNLSLGHLITDAEAMRILSDFRAFKVELYPVEPLMVDAWEMRHNVSAYDALYVVLARLLGACLLTCDRRLAVAAPDVAVVPTT